MAIEVVCPWCAAEFLTSDARAGVTQSCPACGKPVAIPLAGTLPEGKLIGRGSGSASEGSKPVIDLSAPPVARRTVPVPPPLPDEVLKAEQTGPSQWPVVGEPPVVVGPPVVGDGPVVGVSRSATAGKAASSQSKPAESRSSARRRAVVPQWAWVGLAGAGLVAVLLAALYLTKPWRARQATPTRESAVKWVAEEPDLLAENVEEPPAKPKPSTPSEKPSVEKPKPSGRPLVKLPVARSPDDVVKAIVKIRIPDPGEGGSATGTGFLINDFGWVATNYHVVANATTAVQAEFINGQQYQFEGLVAQDPQRDLAILKLADFPLGAMVLDISYDQTPRVGTEVFAVGHPYNVDFSVSKGIVSRVLSTDELLRQVRDAIGREIRAPVDTVWIQHDAKTAVGNSGGPLVDGSGRVLGVNTFLHLKADYGYASHVRYLRALAAKASGQVTPLPPPGQTPPRPKPPSGRPDLEPDLVVRLNDLLVQAKAMDFLPADSAQYNVLAELAVWLTLARHAKEKGLPAHPRAQMLADAAAKADEIFAQVVKVRFDHKRAAAINQFAQERLAKQGEGLLVVGELAGRGPDALLFQIKDTDQKLVVEVPREVAEQAQQGDRWLVLGICQHMQDIVDKQGNTMRVPKVLSYHYHRLE